MIKEFAVQPEVMASWQYFRLLWEDLGVAKGTLISRFPKTWNKQVCELSNSNYGVRDWAGGIVRCVFDGQLGGGREKGSRERGLGKALLPIPRPFHLLGLQRRVRIAETIIVHRAGILLGQPLD
jgi:hypothetical protein